jgi:hypothetical protein
MRRLTAVLLVLSLAVSCGDKEDPTPNSQLSAYFPETIAEPPITRVSDVDTYVGDSLYEYINGGAELYHLYGFELVSNAAYEADGQELILDIYRFDSSHHAFGLYSMLRPDDADIVSIGVEGFASPTTIDFVKGSYVVKLMAFDGAEAVRTAIRVMADRVNLRLPGTTELPGRFSLFPTDRLIEHTSKIYAASFLGHTFLSDVYTRDYSVDGNTITLLLAHDPEGVKFEEWRKLSAADVDTNGLPFDRGQVALVRDSYYGDLLAGSRSGYLAGVVGYTDNVSQFLSAWLESLPEP